ncbi:MAG: 5'-nucleotidase C-terminal domain-containing protein [Bryobacteraceae bacterium]
MALTYLSVVDGTRQPYRIYLPEHYDSNRSYPLVIALHGTTGDEGAFFDDPRYQPGAIKAAADRHQMLVVCPSGRGAREFRGMAEHDVFAVIAEVAREYRIDRNRLYLTGHSMGGTGAARIALHHPGVFAAVAPLSPAYGWPSLAENGSLTPFWWIAGENDKSAFLIGTRSCVDRMRPLNPRMVFDLLPGGNHYSPVRDFDWIFAWFKGHQLGAAPKTFTFVVDTPLHGQAYWVRVDAMQRPGRLGRVDAGVEETRVTINSQNLSRFSILPENGVIPFDRDIVMRLDGHTVYQGPFCADRELAARRVATGWTVSSKPLKQRKLTDYRFTPVGEAPIQLDMHGTEAGLANWMTDAMREATGADVAIMNRQFYRGDPLRAGRLDMVDLLHAMGVYDWNLIVAEFKGRDIVEILDDNVPDPAKDKPYSKDGPYANRLAQVSGIHYSFDSSRPPGQRIVACDVDLAKTYTVALEGHVAHWETLLQAGHFGKFPYKLTEIPLSVALYGHALRQRTITIRREGRVRDVTLRNPSERKRR